MWIFVLALAAAAPVEISVRLGAPADPCALADRVPRALSRMFPGLTVSKDDARSRVVPARGLSVLLVPSGDRVTIELLDASGAKPRVRELPSPPDACAATADGIALVIERHLRDLGWEPSTAPPPELRTETSTLARANEPGAIEPGTVEPGAGTARPAGPRTTTAVDPAIPSARTATVALTDAPRGPPFHLAVGARGVGLLGLAPGRSDGGETSRFAAGGAVLLSFARDALELVIEAGAHVLGGEDILRRDRRVGRIDVWSLEAQLRAGLCLDRAPWALCAGAGGGVERFAASTSGEGIFRGREASAIAPLLAADARAEWAMTERLRLFVGLAALGRPTRTVFSIEGATTTYRVPLFELAATFGGRVTIF